MLPTQLRGVFRVIKKYKSFNIRVAMKSLEIVVRMLMDYGVNYFDVEVVVKLVTSDESRCCCDLSQEYVLKFLKRSMFEGGAFPQISAPYLQAGLNIVV